jgi:hypothetical protein
MRPPGAPTRSFDPTRTAVTGALGAKVADALIDEEFPVAPTNVTVPTRAEAFRQTPAIDANEGEQAALRAMFPDAPEIRQRNGSPKHDGRYVRPGL